MTKPMDAKASGFWLAFVLSLGVLWITCFLSGVGSGFYFLSIVAAVLMGLKHGWVFRPAKSVLVTPPRERWNSLRDALQPQARRAAAVWAFMAVAMLIAACIVFLTESIRLRGIEIKDGSAVLLGFVCLIIAARAGFGAYENFLTLRTLNPSDAEALTARARYITYFAITLLCIIVLIWP